MNTQNNPKELTGTIVSDKMQKTVVVLVKRYVKHPKYHKYMKISKRYKAHNPDLSVSVGDQVTIRECRPMSKDKNFILIANNA